MSLTAALNARTIGPADAPAVVLVHGFGCGQTMWREVAPALAEQYRVVTFDLPGSGAADPSSYDAERHAHLDGYRDDILGLLRELDLREVTLVGHSVSAMIGVLASIAEPETVSRLVLVTPSARYVDDGDYRGGFSEQDIEDLIELMQRNQLGWQGPLAGMVSGAGNDEAQTELYESFCRTDPDVAAQFAALTFRGDNRADLLGVAVPTLVLQVANDMVAPVSAGIFVHEQIHGSRYRLIDTTGHCPHLTAAGPTVEAITSFLDDAPTAA